MTKKDPNITRNPIRCKVLAVSKDLKTCKVQIPRVVPDATYGKRLRRHSVVFADSREFTNVAVNSEVEILPCRRISKNKTWKLATVLSQG